MNQGIKTIVYPVTDDVAASMQSLVATGAQVIPYATDVGDGKLTASVKDADGNIVGLIQEP